MFFEMLTGRRPFQAKNAIALAHKHVKEPLPRLQQEAARYQELMDCLTAKRREDRFGGAPELLAHLDASRASLLAGASSLTVPHREAHVSASNSGSPLSVATAQRSAQRKGATRAPESLSVATAIRTRREAVAGVLDVQATVTRLNSDSARIRDVARTFTRAAPLFLALLAEALNDSNLHFVYEAAHLLKDAVATVEAPGVMDTLTELETYAKERDMQQTVAVFIATQRLVRGLVSELAQLPAS